MTVAMNADQRDLRDPREYDTRRIFIGGDFLVKTSLFIYALKTSQGAEAPTISRFRRIWGADEQRAIRAVSACNTRARIRASVFGGAHAFPCSPLPTSTETGGRRSQIFDFKPDVVLNELTDLPDILRAKEAESFAMKYWEIIAGNLSKSGWSWGCVSAIDSNGRTIFVADTHRDDGKRFVVRADEKLSAFVELESPVRSLRNCPPLQEVR
jgi:hypothetical protein